MEATSCPLFIRQGHEDGERQSNSQA